jgi:hypothetical protein
MSNVWAQRREEVLSDCIVSPDVFNQMVDRLGAYYKRILSGLVLSRFRPFLKSCSYVLLISSMRDFVLFWIRSFVFSS